MLASIYIQRNGGTMDYTYDSDVIYLANNYTTYTKDIIYKMYVNTADID